MQLFCVPKQEGFCSRSCPPRTEGLYLRLHSLLVHLQRGECSAALISALCIWRSRRFGPGMLWGDGVQPWGAVAQSSRVLCHCEQACVSWRRPLLSEMFHLSLVGVGADHPLSPASFPHTYHAGTSLRSASHNFTSKVIAEIGL